MAAATPPRPSPLVRYRRIAVGVALMAGMMLLARHASLPHCAELQGRLESFGAWAPVVFILAYTFATIAFIPGTVLTLLGGLAFGPWLGTALVALGANIGAVLAFLAARYLAREPVEAALARRPWFVAFRNAVATNGLSFVLFARLVPAFPFNGLNYACGLVPLSLKDYVLGSAIGMLPGTFAYVYLGAAGCQLIDSALDGHLKLADLPADVRTSLLTAIGLLAALSLLPFLLKQFRSKPTQG